MNGLPDIDALERWQGRLLWWMAGLSMICHVAVFLLGSTLSSLFPPRVFPPVVTVELTEAPPMTELPDEKPSPPPSVAKAEKTVPADAARVSPTRASRPSVAKRWLNTLDAGLARVQDAPIARDLGRPGGIPVRRWENRAAPRSGDFAPAVAPENKELLKHIASIEGKIRASGIPGVGTGEEIEAAVMFGGVGDSSAEPIPPWIRDMIRRKVREYLPELEAAYSAAFRKNPELEGRLLVRFRIDPNGKVVKAEPEERSFPDAGFAGTVLDKVRRWNFDPTDGRSVEVLYPFVFVSPS